MQSFRNHLNLFPRAQQLAKETKSLMYALSRIAVVSFRSRNRNSKNSSSFISLWKDELVTIAKRDQNSIALSLLSIDRTVGLLRYHGIIPHVSQLVRQHRWLSVSSTTKSAQNELIQQREQQPKTTPPKAKIAFMITSSQKMSLIEKLGYDISQIKKMKPLEALLALEHNITPGNEEVIAKLVEENETLLREEAIRKKKEEIRTLSSSSSSYHFTQGWYEVIQESIVNTTNNTVAVEEQEEVSSSTSVIALYPTEEEALACVTIKEELLAQRSQRSGQQQKSTTISTSKTRFYVRKKQVQE